VTGGTFSCEVREDTTRDAVVITLKGIMHNGPSSHYVQLRDVMEKYVEKRATRFVLVIDELRHISNNGADVILSLSSRMKRPGVHGLVILQGLGDEHMAIYRLAGGAPRAFFALSANAKETERLLDEHKQATSTTTRKET